MSNFEQETQNEEGRRLTISDKESSLHGSLHVVPRTTEPIGQQDTNRQ